MRWCSLHIFLYGSVHWVYRVMCPSKHNDISMSTCNFVKPSTFTTYFPELWWSLVCICFITCYSHTVICPFDTYHGIHDCHNIFDVCKYNFCLRVAWFKVWGSYLPFDTYWHLPVYESLWRGLLPQYHTDCNITWCLFNVYSNLRKDRHLTSL